MLLTGSEETLALISAQTVISHIPSGNSSKPLSLCVLLSVMKRFAQMIPSKHHPSPLALITWATETLERFQISKGKRAGRTHEMTSSPQEQAAIPARMPVPHYGGRLRGTAVWIRSHIATVWTWAQSPAGASAGQSYCQRWLCSALTPSPSTHVLICFPGWSCKSLCCWDEWLASSHKYLLERC